MMGPGHHSFISSFFYVHHEIARPQMSPIFQSRGLSETINWAVTNKSDLRILSLIISNMQQAA